jgi:hypothetical protein
MGPVLHIFLRKFLSQFEVQEAINGLKVGKTPGPNGVLHRALMRLPKRATFSHKLFNAVLHRKYFHQHVYTLTS